MSEYKIEDRGYKTPCWISLHATNRDGYAIISARGRKSIRAHKYFYLKFKGPIPEGFQIDHLCRIRNCVNPDHLEAVSAKTNIRRSDRKMLTEEEIIEIKRLIKSGMQAVLIARRFNISWGTVTKIKSGHLHNDL